MSNGSLASPFNSHEPSGAAANHDSRLTSHEIAISVRNLSKKYRLYDSPQHRLREALHPFRKKYHREFWALKDISFDVKKGETVGIIGKNGSGKSTLLQIICGTLTATGGAFSAAGRISALLELGAGFNPDFTGRANVYLNGAIKGFTKEDMEERFDAIAGFADIGDFIDQPVKTYSSGMYVRLAFAAAIHVEPDILVVDEALSVGDMFFQNKCMKKMKQLMEQGCTTLFVSHDTGAVKSLCSRAVYLADGAVKTIGDSGEVCDLYVSDQREKIGFFKKGDEGRAGDMVGSESDSGIPSNEEESAFEKRVAFLRKGKGDVKIVHAALLDEDGREVTEVDFGRKLTFRATYRSQIALDELVIAFYVKDKNQLEIMGTNNVYENVTIEHISAGNLYSAEFSFVNRLRAGNYGITVLLADSVGTTEYHDWIDGAVVFRSHDRPEEKRWALVNPPMECSHSLIRLGGDVPADQGTV